MINYIIRDLNEDDYHLNHLKLYKQLTHIEPEKITKDKYSEYVSNLNDNHLVKVMYDVDNNKIISSITIIIENKLIRNMGKVGHIEDFVVDKEYRRRGLGKKMIKYAINYCKKMGCYKVILDCNDDKSIFYEKCGFSKNSVCMSYYL